MCGVVGVDFNINWHEVTDFAAKLNLLPLVFDEEFEQLIAMCCQTDKAICLNSATACMENALRVLGIGPGDEVIVPAYTYGERGLPCGCYAADD